MFRAVPLFDKHPNFKLESDDPAEQSWLDRNMERVMDAYVQKAFSDEFQFRGYHNIDVSKLTFQKYLDMVTVGALVSAVANAASVLFA